MECQKFVCVITCRSKSKGLDQCILHADPVSHCPKGWVTKRHNQPRMSPSLTRFRIILLLEDFAPSLSSYSVRSPSFEIVWQDLESLEGCERLCSAMAASGAVIHPSLVIPPPGSALCASREPAPVPAVAGMILQPGSMILQPPVPACVFQTEKHRKMDGTAQTGLRHCRW
jgi:hypothetical protein